MISQLANRYQIISCIGNGGMADVYKANDTILNRIVAIKVLRPKLANDAMTLVRFQREASAASRLSHPNVVDIYDVGEYEGYHYIVMEYIRGRTLKQLIAQRGALDVKEAVYIMRQLTSAVEQAHQHQIIHRDIKPQNILVKDDGTVKITDFGIAVAADSVQLTLNNAVMGSAHYLAPETAQGKDPNPQVDIYSLGIVFYELLTGDVPFHGKTPTEIALKHLRNPMPYPRKINPAISQFVENIVLKATAKNPKERYRSVSEMIYDFDHIDDPQYRDMPRLTFETSAIKDYSINEQGVFDVEYEKKKNTKQPSRSKNPWALIIVGILVGSVLLVLLLSVFGVLKIPGFFGVKTMPDIVDITQEEALQILEDADFDLSKVKVKDILDDSVEAGIVVKTNHKSGSMIHDDDKIVIYISKGPSYLIEDYTGLYIDDVLHTFAESGLEIQVDVQYEGARDTNPGVILKQKGLHPGDRVDPKGDKTITFIVSEYPTITIPSDLIGKDVEAAKEELNALGIAVVTKQTGDSGLRIVVSVSPDVGSEYTQEGTDSVVTLYYD